MPVQGSPLPCRALPAAFEPGSRVKLSVVIPIYNEEKTLEELVTRVQATPHDKELILVNDCSNSFSKDAQHASAS